MKYCQSIWMCMPKNVRRTQIQNPLNITWKNFYWMQCLHIYGWYLESFCSTSFDSLSWVVKIQVFRALWIYPCGFLSSSLWACLRETLAGILWEICGGTKNNQRLVTNTCLKLDIVYGKTSSPHIFPKHIMDILVLMEVAY